MRASNSIQADTFLVSPARPPQLVEGQQVSISQLITPRLIDAIADATGDFNPVHLEQQDALEAGYSRPVAHGLALLGLVSRIIGWELPGPGSVWLDHHTEFLNPVYAGDEVTVTARIASISHATRIVTLDLEGRNGQEVAVMRGRAKVRAPFASLRPFPGDVA